MLRCIVCKKFSISIICPTCQKLHLTPSFHVRELPNGFKVYSFYKYSDISPLIATKHKLIGYFVYNIMAKNSFKEFAKNFDYHWQIYSVGIDDKPKGGYSHTAILSNMLKSNLIIPLHFALRSNNNISYSGKSLDYRLKNKREFVVNIKGEKDLILVDDIVTTGSTILQAKEALKISGQNPLFALCLADARDI